jgi:TPR repeat protein
MIKAFKLVLLTTLITISGFASAEIDAELVERAKQGDAYAQYNLGVAYAFGQGVPEDNKEAVKWYRLAAEQGHASAQYNLGLAYVKGKGVPEDTVIAYAWANLAGANGSDVTKLKEFIEQRMSSEDKSEAQKLTRQMMKDFPDVY